MIRNRHLKAKNDRVTSDSCDTEGEVPTYHIHFYMSLHFLLKPLQKKIKNMERSPLNVVRALNKSE